MPTTTPHTPLRDVPDVPPVVETLGEGLLSVEQTARAFDVSPYTITYWRKWKGIPYVRIAISRKEGVAFRLARVQAWASKHGLSFADPK